MAYNDDLRAAQDRFTRHVAHLINFLHSPEIGLTVSFGEAYRTEYQQKEYLRTGYSKTIDSKHLIRLAIDLNFFSEGRLLLSDKAQRDADYKLIEPLGRFWKDLHNKNQWGGYFEGAWDMGHFETSI